ncbi:hypothetical protein H9655_21360 [Cytobacillus sp. Sa5YUA1]|uniref:Uncharacterized protein n=1 Tax=Cytobacillus stercorigallinarum TaxID=2762240 RepID=A0ABR8QVQ1_9BACI|nr:hypothetical protein [Cytobacillus stercorigallinarum]MBD7939594.1 hypothetical protein [Cytobacillus stercorigallinarum]
MKRVKNKFEDESLIGLRGEMSQKHVGGCKFDWIEKEMSQKNSRVQKFDWIEGETSQKTS